MHQLSPCYLQLQAALQTFKHVQETFYKILFGTHSTKYTGVFNKNVGWFKYLFVNKIFINLEVQYLLI